LVALYFATQPHLDKYTGIITTPKDDCAVYALHDCAYIDVEKIENPFSVSEPGLYIPPHLTARIPGQGGLFSIQPDPRREFQLDFETEKKPYREIKKFIFSAEIIPKLQKDLYLLGIRHGLLFPDLDGFSVELRQRHNLSECHISQASFSNQTNGLAAVHN
jgi:hypothetical protein